jgi:hypothetical protein
MNALHRVPKKGLKTTEMPRKPVPDFALARTHPRHNLQAERPKQKMRFPFELLSDLDEAVCERFGAKKVRGVERSTFVRGVKVPGHAQEVLNFVKAL